MTMARLLAGAAIAILCGGTVACGGPARRLEQARDLALSGHARAALLEARAVLFSLGEKDPKTDDVRRGALKLAGDLCALHLDDAKCAAREYRELVKRYPEAPESFEARARLGDLDLRLGDVKGAIEAFRDQVAAAPDRPGADLAQLKVARALVELGDLDGARRAVSELQSRWPRSALAPQAALLSASTHHLDNHHADAVRAYRAVSELYKGTQAGADALFEMGNCLTEQGQDDNAVKAFTAALSRHKEPEVVQFALERAQRRLLLSRTVDPRDHAAVFDRGVAQHGRMGRVTQ
jgi:tetratricopeptide (TPR) repeat protein